ncbi:MAG TPA: phenylalanine--tRNA ligase subunit beta [Candidatus Omnitrophota bacterium]|nr:phenylalanine--tRNA ligase subunit beta [Candidatus Omnitrophota bacterium]
MKISFNWLKDYVQTRLRPEELADKLTMSGTEVNAISSVGDDAILEMEVTSNRSDCLSHIGIARELAASVGAKLKIPKVSTKISKKHKDYSIQIQDKVGCQRYIGILIKDVQVKESPDWLKKRLESLGLRSVNNIVDITNFCLLEYGQPLHAFDFDKLLNNKIIVRRANKDEKIVTIDGTVRSLDSDILVIADSQKPVAVAGIMGGLNTEVTNNTKNVLLESAYFDPITIRKGSRKLALSSEASYRFERNVDREGVYFAALRAASLILDLAEGKIAGSLDVQTQKGKSKRKIQLDISRLNRILETRISLTEAKSILQRLGFEVSVKKDKLEATVPSFRQDVNVPEDLIEEISRIYGFDKIASSLPAIKSSSVEIQPVRIIQEKLRDTLIANGLNEIISYSLISREELKKCNLENLEPIETANPLSLDQEILKPTAIVGLFTAINHNLSRNIDDIKIFEISNIFADNKETPTLSLAMTGAKRKDWLRQAKDSITFFDLKGLVESLMETLRIEDYKFIAKSFPFLKDAGSSVLTIRGKEIGFLGEAQKEALERWDIKKDKIFIAQFNLEALVDFMGQEIKYKPLALYPSIKRDISFLIKQDTSCNDILQIMTKEAGTYLKDIKLIDFYYGQQIPSNFKSLTYSLEYQTTERTLKDEEINEIQTRIIKALESQLEIKVRR